jgi:hypothetical protein
MERETQSTDSREGKEKRRKELLTGIYLALARNILPTEL